MAVGRTPTTRRSPFRRQGPLRRQAPLSPLRRPSRSRSMVRYGVGPRWIGLVAGFLSTTPVMPPPRPGTPRFPVASGSTIRHRVGSSLQVPIRSWRTIDVVLMCRHGRKSWQWLGRRISSRPCAIARPRCRRARYCLPRHRLIMRRLVGRTITLRSIRTRGLSDKMGRITAAVALLAEHRHTRTS